MKKLIFAVAAMLCFASCLSKLGEEQTTPPLISSVYASTTNVLPGEPVEVTAVVTCEYGVQAVAIDYLLNDDESTNDYAGLWNEGTKATQVKSYSGSIPGQPGGTKVRYRIVCSSMYNVLNWTNWEVYTVADGPAEL